MRTLSELVKTAGSVAGGPAVSEVSFACCANDGDDKAAKEKQSAIARKNVVMSLSPIVVKVIQRADPHCKTNRFFHANEDASKINHR